MYVCVALTESCIRHLFPHFDPRVAASSVNLEFRDIDKFVASLGGSVVIVTDSWILQTNVHSVDIVHQRDAVLQ